MLRLLLNNTAADHDQHHGASDHACGSFGDSLTDEDDDFLSGNGSNPGVPHGKEVTTYIVTSVFFTIFITGICGNILLIFTVVRNLSMRNPPNIFLANMAVGDLLIVLISVPFAAVIYVTSTWPFGLMFCKFNAMLQDISIGVSVFTLVMLSLDRYTAIVTPFKLHNKRAARGCSTGIQVKIMTIWGIAIFFSIPDALNTTLEEIESQDNQTIYYACSPYPIALGHDYHISLVVGKFLVYFVIPVFVIVLVYSLMARQLIFSADFLPSTAQSNQQQLQKQMKTRKSLAKLFLIMVLLFVICFLPKHIFLLWFYGDPDAMDHYNLGWHIFKLISHCLAYMNSCINPLTLYFLSKVFRRYFNRYLFRKCQRNSGNDHSWPLNNGNSQTRLSMPSLDTDAFPLTAITPTDRRRSGGNSIYSTKPSSFSRFNTNYV
ncbi:Neuropeptide CCHamide-1 receptor [Hypsibius exemplaris]|uniref:Neuropeptide CCHamide-1 receptor n=1 Tax=Hypsibius exemplaris TaxID=2072580 RepID=A0A1W0WDX6_HYPEX|nr:Neuropeptide CCHamide-1 receptor [Hypsibius exemplaris]